MFLVLLEFGHYYSYILDFNSSKWFRYDDVNCTEIGEDEVIRVSKGFGDQSAYGLIYFSEALRNKNKETDYRPNATLSAWVPTNLKDEITKENKQFKADLDEYQVTQQVTDIIREYEQKIVAVEMFFRRSN